MKNTKEESKEMTGSDWFWILSFIVMLLTGVGAVGYAIGYRPGLEPEIVTRDVEIREEVCLGHEDPDGF